MQYLTLPWKLKWKDDTMVWFHLWKKSCIVPYHVPTKTMHFFLYLIFCFMIFFRLFFQIPFLSSSRRKMSFFRRNFVYRVSMICFSFFRFEIFSIVVIFFELLYFFQSKDLAVISFLYFLKVWSKFSCTQTPNSWFFKKKNGAKSIEIKWLVSYSNHHHQI